jgi:hypothetical protein
MGMRCLLAALGVTAVILAARPGHADQHVFIIANNADGYGVDRCLATGESCGTMVATAYCRMRDYQRAVSFRKVERTEITGAVPASADACQNGACEDFVAIECTR